MDLGDADVGQGRPPWWLSKSAKYREVLPPLSGQFVFRIVTASSGETFTLPLGISPTFIQDFIVNWGDSSSSTITSYDDADKTHTYTSAGTYDITITGTCEFFGFNNSGDRLKVTALVSLNSDVGFKIFNFYGCSYLASIDSSFSNMSRIVSFYYSFARTGITTIPSGLFDNCLLVTSFEGCFYYTDVSAIPTGLFDNCTLVTTFEMCFGACIYITVIPAGLFDNCTLITTFSWTFAECDITVIPAGLFDNCTLVTTFSWTFGVCFSLVTIPAGLFDNCTLLTNLNYCFDGDSSINSLPVNLIQYNTKLDNCQQMFIDCSNMVGDGTAFVDQGILHGVSEHSNCFRGCTSLPDYALIPADWK